MLPQLRTRKDDGTNHLRPGGPRDTSQTDGGRRQPDSGSSHLNMPHCRNVQTTSRTTPARRNGPRHSPQVSLQRKQTKQSNGSSGSSSHTKYGHKRSNHMRQMRLRASPRSTQLSSQRQGLQPLHETEPLLIRMQRKRQIRRHLRRTNRFF